MSKLQRAVDSQTISFIPLPRIFNSLSSDLPSGKIELPNGEFAYWRLNRNMGELRGHRKSLKEISIKLAQALKSLVSSEAFLNHYGIARGQPVKLQTEEQLATHFRSLLTLNTNRVDYSTISIKRGQPLVETINIGLGNLVFFNAVRGVRSATTAPGLKGKLFLNNQDDLNSFFAFNILSPIISLSDFISAERLQAEVLAKLRLNLPVLVNNPKIVFDDGQFENYFGNGLEALAEQHGKTAKKKKKKGPQEDIQKSADEGLKKVMDAGFSQQLGPDQEGGGLMVSYAGPNGEIGSYVPTREEYDSWPVEIKEFFRKIISQAAGHVDNWKFIRELFEAKVVEVEAAERTGSPYEYYMYSWFSIDRTLGDAIMSAHDPIDRKNQKPTLVDVEDQLVTAFRQSNEVLEKVFERGHVQNSTALAFQFSKELDTTHFKKSDFNSIRLPLGEAVLSPVVFDQLTTDQKGQYMVRMEQLSEIPNAASRNKLREFLKSGIMKETYEAELAHKHKRGIPAYSHAFWLGEDFLKLKYALLVDLLGTPELVVPLELEDEEDFSSDLPVLHELQAEIGAAVGSGQNLLDLSADSTTLAEPLPAIAFEQLPRAEQMAYINDMSMLSNSKRPEAQALFKAFLLSGLMSAEYQAYAKPLIEAGKKPAPQAYWFARSVLSMPDGWTREILDMKYKKLNERRSEHV